MRDGVVLRADIYRPDAEAPVAAIVNRTPYDRSSPLSQLAAIEPQRVVDAGFPAVADAPDSGPRLGPAVRALARALDRRPLLAVAVDQPPLRPDRRPRLHRRRLVRRLHPRHARELRWSAGARSAGASARRPLGA